MHLSTITLCLAAFASMALGVPRPPTLEDYDVDASDLDVYWNQSPSWQVQPHPGAEPISLNGTAQQLYAKLKEINPNYDDDWKDIPEEPKTATNAAIERRDDEEFVLCGHYLEVWARNIDDGIEFLRGLKGTPRLGAGSNTCGRVSCSYGSAIYWCNDDNKPRELPSYNNIADGAQAILNECTGFWQTVSGSLHHVDKWRTVVRHVGRKEEGC